MKNLHIFLILAACNNHQTYTLQQQGEYKFDITRVKDSIFIKTMTDKGCMVDTFYKGKDGYYAIWCKKLIFATVDTLVLDTEPYAPFYTLPIHIIRKVTEPRKNPILLRYKEGLYKTEIVSYNEDYYKPLVADLLPELIIAYYYDRNYNIVGIKAPYIINFSK